MGHYLWATILMIGVGISSLSVWAGESPTVGEDLPEVARDAVPRAFPLDAQRQAVPNIVGPLDYTPASPSDELRDGMSVPVQQLEESPVPAPSPLNDSMG